MGGLSGLCKVVTFIPNGVVTLAQQTRINKYNKYLVDKGEYKPEDYDGTGPRGGNRCPDCLGKSWTCTLCNGEGDLLDTKMETHGFSHGAKSGGRRLGNTL